MLGSPRVRPALPLFVGGDPFLTVSPRLRRPELVGPAFPALVVGAALWLFGAAWAAAADPSTPPSPASPSPPASAPQQTAPPGATSPASSPPAKAPSLERAQAPADDEKVMRGAISTRGEVESRVGIAVGLETRSAMPWGLQGGPGLEVDLFQTQRGSSVFSYLPVYWAIEYRPVKRLPHAFLSARVGWDLLGQEGDDTLASRGFYAFGIGLITRADRPKPLQWEILYSRMRGAFPGIGLSVGYRFR